MSSTRSNTRIHGRPFRLSVVLATVAMLAVPSVAAQSPTQPRRTAQPTARPPGQPSGGGRPSASSAVTALTGVRPPRQQGGGARGRTATGAARGTQQRGGQTTGRGARQTTRQSRASGGAVVTATGTAAAASGGAVGAGTTAPGQGAFEPYRNEPVDWKEIPDEGKQIVALDAPAMSVGEFLQTISLTMGWTVVMSEGVAEKTIHAYFNQVSVRDALKVLRFAELYYEYDKETNVLTVTPLYDYYLKKYGKVEQFEYDVKHADVMDMQATLQTMLSPQGRIIADGRQSRLIIYDTKHNREYIESLLELLDVEIQPVVFTPQYARADELANYAQQYLLTMQGLAQADMRTNTLFVWDIPESIERVRAYIEAVDVEVMTRTFELKYAVLEEVESMLMQLIPEDMGIVQTDPRMRQITVTSTPQKVADAAEIIETLDKESRQVHIKAYIMRANAELIRNLGIRWSQMAELPDGKPISIAVSPEVAAGSAVVSIAPEGGYDFNAVIDLLLTDGDTEVLSEPEVTVTDGMSATFGEQTRVPYLSGSSVQYSGTGAPAPGDPTDISRYYRYFPQRVTYENVGIRLQVTPTINLLGDIDLQISVEDSDFQKVPLPGVGDVPQVTASSVNTQVLVASGSTIVLGGLRGNRRTDTVDKIPVLGDVPIVGAAFRASKQSDSYKELLIFITPTVVSLGSSARVQDLAEFREQLQDRSETMRHWPVGSVWRDEKQPLEPVSKRGLEPEEHNIETEGEASETQS